MVFARSGAALAACVVLACSTFGGVCCAELALEKSYEHSTFRLFYSVRKLTWAQARELCNLSSVAPGTAGANAASAIGSSTLLELTRRQRPQFENAWVVSSRGGGDCLEVVATCDQSIESPVGQAGCATKRLSVVISEQQGCPKRTKNAVICHQERRRPALPTESSMSAAGKTTTGKQDNHVEGNEGNPAISHAQGTPTQATRVRVISPVATTLAVATTTDPRSRAYNEAGSETTVAQPAVGNRILWATSAFFKGLEKGEKSMLGLILGSIGAVFVICSVAVALFCIHPSQRRGKKDAQSGGTGSSIGTDEAFPLLPVTDRHADAPPTVPLDSSGGVTDGEHVSASAAMTATVSDVEALAASAVAVGPAESSSHPLDGRSQPAPAIATNWHRAAEAAAVPPSHSSPSLQQFVDLKRRSTADETAETLLASNVASGAWLRPGSEPTAAAPTGRTMLGRAARRTEQTLSVVHDLSESSEEDEQRCQLPLTPDAHRPSDAAVAAAVAAAAAATARRSEQAGGCSSTSGASECSRFVSAPETHSTNSSSRSRSSSTASSDTWWPPVDFGAGSSAGDSYMNSSGIMVTAL